MLSGECYPTLPLSGPGDSESVAPQGREPWGPKRGPITGVKNRHFSPRISGHGCGVEMPLLVRWGPVCPHIVLKGQVPAPQAEWSPGGRVLTLTQSEGG